MMTAILCGCCGASLNKLEAEAPIEEHFRLKCSLCDTTHSFKHSHARKLYAKATNLGSHQHVSIVEFESMSSPFRCRLCKQMKCFYCGKSHNDGN